MDYEGAAEVHLNLMLMDLVIRGRYRIPQRAQRSIFLIIILKDVLHNFRSHCVHSIRLHLDTSIVADRRLLTSTRIDTTVCMTPWLADWRAVRPS